MIFDTHAHYDDERFDPDREEVLSTLREKNVGRVVNVGSSMETSETTLALAKQHDFVYAAVGVHPDEVRDLSERDIERLRALCTEYGYRYAADPLHPGGKKIVAVGEIGFDYARDDGTPKEIQRKWFVRQLALSNELDLPVVIHSRDAAQDTYDVLKEMKTGEDAGIVHCFSYSGEMALRFVELGYSIALGGVVTFKNGRVAKEVAEAVPDRYLLLETDAPYLAPTPFRGERNDSSKISYVAEAIAALRGTDAETILRLTWENANRIYRIRG